VTEDRSLTSRLVAEALGTFALCFVGILAIYNGSAFGPFGGSATLLSVALAHGLTIAVMASAFMLVSGAHFNPAVTFACWLGKQISSRDAAMYVAVQVLAGLAGALLARLVLDGQDISAGVPGLGDGVSATSGILIEATLTMFLVLVVYGTGVDPRFGARVGGLAIGLTVALDILAGGPLTGAAMNPARWLGPAIVAGDLGGMAAAVYLIGPLLGGLFGGLLYTKVIRPGLPP
jgi:aquaporin TIP